MNSLTLHRRCSQFCNPSRRLCMCSSLRIFNSCRYRVCIVDGQLASNTLSCILCKSQNLHTSCNCPGNLRKCPPARRTDRGTSRWLQSSTNSLQSNKVYNFHLHRCTCRYCKWHKWQNRCRSYSRKGTCYTGLNCHRDKTRWHKLRTWCYRGMWDNCTGKAGRFLWSNRSIRGMWGIVIGLRRAKGKNRRDKRSGKGNDVWSLNSCLKISKNKHLKLFAVCYIKLRVTLTLTLNR